MRNELTTADLFFHNGKPTIADLVLAERLGYEKPRDVREIIKRNIPELERWGPLIQVDSRECNLGFSRTARLNPAGKGRPGQTYILNEGQAATIAMLSRTEVAADVRFEIIKVFLAARNGELEAVAPAPRPADAPSPVDEMARKLNMVTEARMSFGPAVAARLWQQLGLPDATAPVQPRMPTDALSCLRHLLSLPIDGGTIRAAINAAFQGDKLAVAHLKAMKIEIKGDGFTVPNIHAPLTAHFAGTPWQRPFEYLRKLPGAKPHLPFGGRFAGDFTFLPSVLLDA